MLQFTLTPNPNMTLAQQAAMAARVNCAWVEIDPTEVPEEELNEIIDTCRDNEIILVFTHHDVLLEQKRVHGIHLTAGDADPQELRNRLGGHPIIGIDVTPDVIIPPLKRADVDYLVLDGYPVKNTLESIRQLMDNQLKQCITIPIVVAGRIADDEIQSIVDAGASGINININSLQGPEYEASLASFLAACDNITR